MRPPVQSRDSGSPDRERQLRLFLSRAAESFRPGALYPGVRLSPDTGHHVQQPLIWRRFFGVKKSGIAPTSIRTKTATAKAALIPVACGACWRKKLRDTCRVEIQMA
jgi:hypothetical protein